MPITEEGYKMKKNPILYLAHQIQQRIPKIWSLNFKNQIVWEKKAITNKQTRLAKLVLLVEFVKIQNSELVLGPSEQLIIK
jgi:hypothetical protein